MSPSHRTHSPATEGHGSLASYAIGFVFSCLLTLLPYLLVSRHLLSGSWALLAISLLAVLQLLVQLFFFLHLGEESQPRWRLLVFLFAAMVVAILFFGSLWIMAHLAYLGLPSDQLDRTIFSREAIPQ